MQLTTVLAALLLAAPSFVAAAPTSNGITANLDAFAVREATCNAPIPTDTDDLDKYTANMAKMSAATVAAHAGEVLCYTNRAFCQG
jgi:hypothetical protein